MPDCDSAPGPAARPLVRPGLPFLDFRTPAGFPAGLLIPDRRGLGARIELAMATMAGMHGPRRMRVACLMSGSRAGSRAVYVGREPCGGVRSLSQAVEAADGRPCSDDDFIFPLVVDGMGHRPADRDILRMAIHNVAVLVAAGERTASCSTAYVCACVVLVSSMGINERGRGLADDFLRMWLRAELGGGDPPEWNHATVQRLRAIDPWAASFMQGLGDATRGMDPLAFPASLADIAGAALDLRAQATLGQCEPAGHA